ncbi:hypothetical protein MB84_30105 (plasmid) [Pandoraea oxalativorans]|uniref:Transposase IS4-like domain-containing protein n=1 Tax=Pandoraea oxalativorans TaxID=573737 RepID=A0A0G3IGL9_9BURK|nr:hypothetical protein MB84_30105 [Pandoraea oxalativorans]
MLVELSLPTSQPMSVFAEPARVEHVFASLAQMGGKALRSIGLARATLRLHWKAATYNLRRLCSLKQAGPRPF